MTPWGAPLALEEITADRLGSTAGARGVRKFNPNQPVGGLLRGSLGFPLFFTQLEEPTVMSSREVLLAFVLTLGGLVLVVPQPAKAHCQIPCGIYDDHARVKSMLEDAATVEKSARLIGELAGKTDAQSQNQLIRWVTNKETHAQKIIATISDYFLTQRIKPSQKDYVERLKNHHAVILAAMKAKQQSDPKYAKALTQSIGALSTYYPEHKH